MEQKVNFKKIIKEAFIFYKEVATRAAITIELSRGDNFNEIVVICLLN